MAAYASTEPGFSFATPASNSWPTCSQFNGNNQRACAGVEYEELFPGQLTRTDQSDSVISDRYRIIIFMVAINTLAYNFTFARSKLSVDYLCNMLML